MKRVGTVGQSVWISDAAVQAKTGKAGRQGPAQEPGQPLCTGTYSAAYSVMPSPGKA
jgi:hypothetical protein